MPGIPPSLGIRSGCGRPRPSLPIRCTLQPSPRSPISLVLKRVQTEVPSGLAPRARAAAGTAIRKHMAAVPRIPYRQLAGLGRQRHRRIRHASAAYQQASLSVTASV